MERASFVFLSTTDWDAPQFGSRQQIARELGRRGHLVLFVEIARALHSLISDPEGSRRALARMGQVRSVSDGVLAYTPWPVLPIYYSPVTNAVNQRLLAHDVRGTLRRLARPIDVFWTYWPNSAAMVGRLGERVSVYHCIDNATGSKYPFVALETVARMEQDLCRRVDRVWARSQLLLERCQQANARSSVLAGGVDLAQFQMDDARTAPELDAWPHPRIGFVGTLDDRLDVTLIEACARAFPQATITLVGPIKRHLVHVDSLAGFANVRLLPPCAPERAPHFVAGMDVCLIPYRVYAYTLVSAPIKLYEYLAMGKPVVSTALPYVEREAAHVRIARNTEEFVDAVREALAHPPIAEQRAAWRAAAERQSWAGQVDIIEQTLAPLLEARP